MQISETPFYNLTATERAQLAQLTVDNRSHMARVLQEAPLRSMCWLATEADSVAGWSLVRWYSPQVKSITMGYLSVFVDPLWRRRGLGRELVRCGVVFAEEKSMYICAYGFKKQQQEFYLSCGLREEQISRQSFPLSYWENYRFVRRLLPRISRSLTEGR